MTDVIDILERMGSDAALREAPRQALEQVLAEERIDEPVRVALLSGDRAGFQSLMGAGAQFSIIMPGEEEAPADEEEGEELPPDEDGMV